jgi:multidrug efflux system membrane fusion protein
MMYFRRGSGLTLLICTALLTGCEQDKGSLQPPPVPVVVAAAAAKTLPFEINSFGHVEAYRTISIRSQIGGTLSRVHFTEGQLVKRGEPLFLVDPAPYKAALAAAEAMHARDQVMAANLAESVQRYEQLVQKDYITAQEHSDMLAQLGAMKATVRADEAAVENARLNLQYCSIAAPVAGRVGARLVDEGNVIKANSDNPLAVVRQIQPIYVSFTVPEQHLPDLLRQFGNRELEVRANAPEEPPGAHKGRLTFIDNAVDTATGTILLKAEFANEDASLWPGEFVKVVLVLKQLEGVVVVPSQAIDTGQNGDFLFVVKPDNTVEVRTVEVIYRRGNETVVGAGVQPGEKIVIDGQLRLRPGSKVVEKSAVSAGEANAS